MSGCESILESGAVWAKHAAGSQRNQSIFSRRRHIMIAPPTLLRQLQYWRTAISTPDTSPSLTYLCRTIGFPCRSRDELFEIDARFHGTTPQLGKPLTLRPLVPMFSMPWAHGEGLGGEVQKTLAEGGQDSGQRGNRSGPRVLLCRSRWQLYQPRTCNLCISITLST